MNEHAWIRGRARINVDSKSVTSAVTTAAAAAEVSNAEKGDGNNITKGRNWSMRKWVSDTESDGREGDVGQGGMNEM